MKKYSNAFYDPNAERIVFRTKYDFDEEMQQVIEQHFLQGLLKGSLPGALGISERTYHQWRKDHLEFKDYVDLCYPLAKLHIDNIYRRVAEGEEHPHAAIIHKRHSIIIKPDLSDETRDTLRDFDSSYRQKVCAIIRDFADGQLTTENLSNVIKAVANAYSLTTQEEFNEIREEIRSLEANVLSQE